MNKEEYPIEEELEKFMQLSNNLMQENKQLKEQLEQKEFLLKSQGKELKELYNENERINKAIEYIENWQIDFYEYECDKLIMSKNDMYNLLEILKGGKNE